MAPRATRRAEDATVAPAPHPREIVAEGFRSFLHENFSGPYQVARAFYVEDRTAEYWWQGKHVPNGVMVCLAFGMHPDSAARHLRLVVDNPQSVERPALTVRPALARRLA
jgi:hypothetical protein